MSQPPPPRLPPSPNDLTDALLNSYIEHFLDIADFRTIDNGKALLELIRLSPDHPKLKPAIRKVVGLFGCQAPAGRVCALQFLKEALEAGSFFTAECLEKSVLVHFAEIIEYRAPVRSIQRGSTYFCRQFDKNISDEEMINLVKLSSTFFRMVHECLYVWGALYFPGSAFDRLRAKMEKKVAFPEFPKEFKFYSETKVNNFKERCSELIRKVEEKSMGGAESGSVERKADSVGKEKERHASNSPRSIKKTKQPIKQQSSKQLKESAKQSVSLPPKQQPRAANEQSVKEQQQIDKQQEKAAQDNPPSSKRTKRHKPKKNKSSKKQFIENIKEETDKISQNNSSKLRKKNSFIEVPFDLEKQMPPLRHTQSTELHQPNQAKSRDLPSKATTLIKTIQQHEESDGGRYSMDEALSKESEISEIMYQYNNRETQSPRSQYSLKNRQAKGHMSIKRENSQQLQPSITARGKDTKKQAKQQQTQKSKPKQQQQRQVIVQDINQVSPTKKQHSFKLPLNQLKGRMEVAAQPSKHQSSERRRHDKDRERKSTARKKFVSSQEQSVKEHRQEQMKQQFPTVVKNFNENSSLEYESNAKNEVKMTKHQNGAAAEQRQQRNDAPAVPPKPKQPQNQTAKEAAVQPPMPVKSSKPIKLKSNSNLKTVFESAGYKVVQVPNKNNEQTGDRQGSKTNNQQKQPLQPTLSQVQKKSSRNASEMPPMVKQAKKASIFETVQADTIETINELTPLTRKPDTKPSSPAKVQLYDVPEQPTSKVTIRREQMSQLPKDNQEATHRQAKTPARDQRSISLQNRPLRKGTEEQRIQQHQNQTILHNSRQNEEEDRSMEVYQQLRPIRRNSTFSSRFRHFKEVNLFIQPKSTQPVSTSEPLMPLQPHSDQDQKAYFIEELNKIKTVILQREENLNLTLMSLRSEMPPDRKSSEQTKIETATQTKLRHKSKGKFERKNKYRLFDDLSRSQENTSLINLPPLPKDASQSSKPAQMPPVAMARKPSTVQKQQLKPNTLLYALYKRKYSNV